MASEDYGNQACSNCGDVWCEECEECGADCVDDCECEEDQ